MAEILEQNARKVSLRLADCVEVDPARLGGQPVFRGTRVPVKSLFDHLKGGDSLDIFLDDFPGVTREQVLAVLDVARLNLADEIRTR